MLHRFAGVPEPLVAEETTSTLVSIPERLCFKRDLVMPENAVMCLGNVVLGVNLFASILVAMFTMFMW